MSCPPICTRSLRPRSYWEPGHHPWQAPVWTRLFASVRPKTLGTVPKHRYKVPILSSDTSLHTITSAQAFYPWSSALIVNMVEGLKEELNTLIDACSTSSLNYPQNRVSVRALCSGTKSERGLSLLVCECRVGLMGQVRYIIISEFHSHAQNVRARHQSEA